MFEVLEADLSDRAQAAALVNMIAEHAASDQGRRQPMTAEERAGLIPALQNYPCKRILLARTDSELCGLAVCFVQLSTFSARRMLKIHDLYVAERWRKHGAGRALVAAAIAAAREMGCLFVNVEVALENLPAIHLYEAVDFIDWMTPTKFMEIRLS
jgi:GNAT superfamily N-acetyltransferase